MSGAWQGWREAVIAAGSGVSGWVDCRGDVIGAIELPAALTTAGQVVIEHSWDGQAPASPLIVWPDAAQLALPFVAGAVVLLPAGQWATLGFLRLVAGTSAAPVVQAADRRFRLGRRAG